jgi:hypothetical protein
MNVSTSPRIWVVEPVSTEVCSDLLRPENQNDNATDSKIQLVENASHSKGGKTPSLNMEQTATAHIPANGPETTSASQANQIGNPRVEGKVTNHSDGRA